MSPLEILQPLLSLNGINEFIFIILSLKNKTSVCLPGPVQTNNSCVPSSLIIEPRSDPPVYAVLKI